MHSFRWSLHTCIRAWKITFENICQHSPYFSVPSLKASYSIRDVFDQLSLSRRNVVIWAGLHFIVVLFPRFCRPSALRLGAHLVRIRWSRNHWQNGFRFCLIVSVSFIVIQHNVSLTFLIYFISCLLIQWAVCYSRFTKRTPWNWSCVRSYLCTFHVYSFCSTSIGGDVLKCFFSQGKDFLMLIFSDSKTNIIKILLALVVLTFIRAT
jgi:hypothetical protein